MQIKQGAHMHNFTNRTLISLISLIALATLILSFPQLTIAQTPNQSPVREIIGAVSSVTDSDTERILKIPYEVKLLEKGYFYAESTYLKTPETPVPGVDIKISVLSEIHSKMDPIQEREIKVYHDSFNCEIVLELAKGAEFPDSISLNAAYQACVGEMCLMPVEKEITIDLGSVQNHKKGGLQGTSKKSKKSEIIEPLKKNDDNKGGVEKAFESGMPSLIALMFVGGFLASLTPCVWPMVPITVGILGSISGGGRLRGFAYSLIYVTGISITYATLGILAASSGSMFGAASANPIIVSVVFTVFLLFGLSMLDVFTIQIPGNLASRFQQKRTGIIGVFLMGILAGLVASPCIAPVVGTLLALVAKTGNQFLGAVGLAAFAWGMGMIFILLGTFTGLISALPRSGMWMVDIKHLMGAAMILGAHYFLAPVISPTAMMIMVGFACLTLGVGGGGIEPLPQDGGSLKTLRKSISITLLAVGLTLLIGGTLHISGLWTSAQSKSIIESGLSATEMTPKTKAETKWLTDSDEALKLSANSGKPLIMDFYADWCVQCKRLDQDVFSKPEFLRACDDIILAKIDMTENKKRSPEELAALKNQYNIYGVPKVIFFRSDGRIDENLSFQSYLNLKQVLEKIRKLKENETENPDLNH
jgi:thiol:disulfide interchange protein DsbD